MFGGYDLCKKKMSLNIVKSKADYTGNKNQHMSEICNVNRLRKIISKATYFLREKLHVK